MMKDAALALLVILLALELIGDAADRSTKGVMIAGGTAHKVGLRSDVDWRRCVMQGGPPLPMQKPYHPNPNKGIS